MCRYMCCCSILACKYLQTISKLQNCHCHLFSMFSTWFKLVSVIACEILGLYLFGVPKNDYDCSH